MLAFIKKYLKPKNKSRYSLKITGLVVRNNQLFCRLDDLASLNPYEIPADKIFSNDRVMSQLKPRELLKLKEKYDRFVQQYVVLTETQQNNKYRLNYGEQDFLMEGQDICKNFNLLQSMRIEDAFRIIYSTGFENAFKVAKHVVEMEIVDRSAERSQKSGNVLPLKRD